MDGQLKRIAAFLNQYVNCDGYPTLPENEVFVKDAISVLVEQNVMSVSEIRREALRDYDVIIPWDYFPMEEE